VSEERLMRQVTYAAPQTVRTRTRGALLFAAAAVVAVLAISALVVSSEQGETRQAPYDVVSGSASGGLHHDGGYYRALNRRLRARGDRRAAAIDNPRR
jgi:hypothetical protein